MINYSVALFRRPASYDQIVLVNFKRLYSRFVIYDRGLFSDWKYSYETNIDGNQVQMEIIDSLTMVCVLLLVNEEFAINITRLKVNITLQ